MPSVGGGGGGGTRHVTLFSPGNYPGDYRHKSGDREMRFKIWSLPDQPGELTAQ